MCRDSSSAGHCEKKFFSELAREYQLHVGGIQKKLFIAHVSRIASSMSQFALSLPTFAGLCTQVKATAMVEPDNTSLREVSLFILFGFSYFAFVE